MRNAVRPSALLALFAPFAAVGCNEANFKSESKTKEVPEKVTTTCAAAGQYNDEELQFKAKNKKEARLFVEGEFCPLAPAELRIVFLVDFSLSMYNANVEPVRGNDPVKNGSCGRLEAARAIVKRQAEELAGQKAEVKIGVVQFASELEGQIPLTTLADFDKLLTVDNFCKGTTATNYRVAFEAATQMLQAETGTKTVYLISDGLPTEGGGGARENAPRHRDAAQKAADGMRIEVENLVYNTVFLKNTHELAEDNFDPKEFLIKLTGDEKHVKIVDKAEALAEEIVKLENPPVQLDTQSVRAAVTSAGTEVAVNFLKFEAVAGKTQVWRFMTEDFEAFPGPGKDLQSELTVTAKDSKGTEYSVTFRIKPRPGPAEG